MIEKVKAGKAAMLAYKLNKKPVNWNDQHFIQPKLDGVRCLFTRQGAFSRTGKQFKNVGHIEMELARLFKDNPKLVLDGELYNHEYKHNFNKIISLVRQGKPTADQVLIQFHCYDIVSELGYPFDNRNHSIKYVVNRYKLRYVHTVKTISVPNMGLAVITNNRNLKQGYEGSILRKNSPYESRRSYNLQKFKAFQDTEAKVIGYVAGKGKRTGGIGKFICVDAHGIEFGVPCMDKFEELKNIWDNREDYLNKMITFTFFNKTPRGSYRHPIFKCLRTYE